MLNVCWAGRVDAAAAFRGLAPQLVRMGVPAVVGMQYAIADDAASLFAVEFYRRLCTGEGAGQVDAAITYARNMLAVLFPASAAWAAPVLYTHAADGMIYRLPEAPGAPAVSSPPGLATLVASFQESMALEEDWSLAEPGQLRLWRATLLRAAEAYRLHALSPDGATRQAARFGLAHVARRVATLETEIARREG
jgi:hypothetical protein